MKNSIGVYLSILVVISGLLLSGCKKEKVPVLTTTEISNITLTTAISGGNITDEGSSQVIARGVCWSTTTKPTIADSITSDSTGVGSFVSSISGLTPNTNYFVRAYAANGSGTGYGMEMSFTTQNYETVTDIDGNVYKTITIGTQIWMAENLKTTKFNDGTAISLVTDNTAWNNLTTPAYCWFNNDASTYKATYGALYNWYTVNTGMLCPTGWHVPSEGKWRTLTTYLGGESVAGGKLKETGTAHWNSPNTGATNESGFTALPGGSHSKLESFSGIGYYGFWWSSTPRLEHTGGAWERSMYFDFSDVWWQFSYKEAGYSVRCLKD